MLKIKELEAGYGKIEILHKVSFDVGRNEVVVLLGSNGMGKTTVMKTIAGIIKPKSGTIEFMGQEVGGLSEDEIVRRGIVFVMDQGAMFLRMTIKENLLLGAYTIKDRNRIRESMDYVFDVFPRLKEREGQLVGTLSGGEFKMASLGRSLMANPKIVLVDEPSMGLAPKLVTGVFDALNKLKHDGITILLVEQNVNLGLKIAERGYIMEQGSVVLNGRSEDLLNNREIKKKYLGL